MNLQRRPLIATLGLGFVMAAATAAAREPDEGSSAKTAQHTDARQAPLVQKARTEIDALSEKVKRLEQKAERLKQDAKSTDVLLAELQRLLPWLIEAVGTAAPRRPGGPASPRQADPFAARLVGEFATAGLQVPPDEVRATAASIQRGGCEGTTLAILVTIEVAEASAARLSSWSAPPFSVPGATAALAVGQDTSPDFPKLSAHDRSTACALLSQQPSPHGSATSFIAQQFAAQSTSHLAGIAAALSSVESEIKVLQTQIAALRAQIQKLE